MLISFYFSLKNLNLIVANNKKYTLDLIEFKNIFAQLSYIIYIVAVFTIGLF